MGDLELYEYLHERHYYENGRLFFKKDLKNQIKAGDEAVKELHGEFAVLNFPND